MASDKQVKNAQSFKDIMADINRQNEESLKIEREKLKIEKERLATDQRIRSEQMDISNVIKNQTKQLQFQKAEKSSILKATNAISRISESVSTFAKEEIADRKKLKKLGEDSLTVDKKINSLRLTQKKLRTETAGLDADQIKANFALAESIEDQIDNATKLKTEIRSIELASNNVFNDKSVKRMKGFSEIFSNIPGFKGLSGAFEDAGQASEKVVADMQATNFAIAKTQALIEEGGLTEEEALDQTGITKEQFDAGPYDKAAQAAASSRASSKALADNFKKALGPIVIITAFFDALKTADKEVGELAKGMNLTYQEAAAVRTELTDMAFESGNTFVNSSDLAETLGAINASMGTGVQLSEEMLVQFTEMREMAGFTNEELMGIAKISAATGKEMDEITGEFMSQAKISSMQQGVLLNEKDLLKSINEVSAATTLSFGKNPKLIAEAVATAKALGMELSKVEGIADSLLDFESSITNELEAELLLNKDINLERARQAALNNDLATVAKEISDQIGSAAEFTELNRIQQEALAKSVGMNRDDLAETLFIQDQLAGLTGEKRDEEEAILQNRIAQVGLEQAQNELAQKGIDGLREQMSMADRFAKSMEKVKEIFVLLAEPILMVTDLLSPILQVVGFLLKHIKAIGESFGGIGGVLLGIIPLLAKASFIAKAFAVLGFKGAVAAIFRTFAQIPLGIGIPLAIGAVAGLSSLMKKGVQAVGDLKIDPNGGPIVSSPNMGGIFQGRKDDALRMGNQQALDNPSVVQQDNSKVENLLSQMITVQKATLKKTPEVAPLGLYEVQ